MCKNNKPKRQRESETEIFDLTAQTGAQLGKRTDVCLEKDPRIKTGTEGAAKDSKELFPPEASTPHAENEIETSISSGHKLRILVVDDNENVREVLEDFLNFEGHQPVLAKDGEEALKIFSNQDFDMVITDLGMPGMSGWELSRHIKQKKPEIPVVIITGWGAQLSPEDLKENKVELVLSKPFNLDQVKQITEGIGAKLLSQERRDDI